LGRRKDGGPRRNRHLYPASARGSRVCPHLHSTDVRDIDNALDANGRPLVALPNILPTPNALGAIGREDFILGTDPHFRDPRSYQWNLTIERELLWHSVLRASYIGLQSVGIPERVDLNQVPASPLPYSPSRLFFQNWGYLGSVENIGFANYQGLQIEATRGMRNGAYLQATYTHSKNLGSIGTATRTNFPAEATGPGVTDRYDTRYDRGDFSGSRRDRFLLAGILPLPLGRGRFFGANWHGEEQHVLGGWELSTLSLIQSGPFLTPTINGFDSSNTNLFSRASARPDRIGNGKLPDPTPGQYFDKSAFVAAPRDAGRFGNSGVGVLVGPGTVAIAAGVAKTFSIAEKARVRFEATFTNLPNHPNFAPPNTNISSTLFGRLTTVQSVENSGNRRGQIGVRVDF
jgi:hypothetical protein